MNPFVIPFANSRSSSRKVKTVQKKSALRLECLEERAVPAISIATSGVPVTENFDSLASSGSSATLPTGWEILETGTAAAVNGMYTAGTGSSNSGDTYSFGTTAADRTLGSVRSGTLNPVIGASFTNSTAAAFISLDISYFGEQWRLGTAGRADRIDFQYSLNATSLATGTWVDVNALDFSSPTTTGTLGALNGNLAANRTAVSATISSLSISPGSTFWIRWNDLDASGADDGLAIDDFSLTATSATGSSTATTLDTISASNISYGDSVTFTGTVVNQTGSTTPAGTIEIRNGGAAGTLLASTTTIDGTNANGTFSITSTDVPVGTFNSVRAYFIPGSVDFNSSDGSGPSLTVINVAFTAGNLAVLQADEADGNSPFSILEVNASTAGQTSVNGVPINGTSIDFGLRLDGTTTFSNGYLATTNYGQYLTFTGISGDSVVLDTGNASGNTPRGVGILDYTGAFSSPTSTLGMESSGTFTYVGTVGKVTRGATSLDNSTFFITDDGGIYTNNSNNDLGAAEIPATTFAETGFYRSTKAFGGTVYIGISSSNVANAQVSTLSAPTATGVITSLPGLPNSTSIKDFYLIQSGNNGAAYDVLYVMSSTSSTAGTISKFALISGTWTAKGTSTTTFGGFGIAAADNADGALLYVTSGTGTESGGSVIKLTDTANWDADIAIVSASNVVLYTAPTPKILKGISFTPQDITVSPPTVTDPTAAALTASSATLGGNVTADGNAWIAERGVIYVPSSSLVNDPDPIIGDSGVVKQTATGTTGVFTANVTGLTAGIEYTYRAYATNSGGTTYTDLASFTTPSSALAPSVDSPAATNIAPYTVTLGGNVASDGGDPIIERGVIFVLTSLADADPVEFEDGVVKQAAISTPAIGGFTVDISGLDANTSYTYRAYADNGIGRTYSDVATFTTAAAVAPQITSSSNLAIRPVAAATFQVTASGNPAAFTYGLSAFSSGASSDWISIDPNGLITFADNANRPTVSSPTEYTFTITVDNGVAPAATQSFTLTDGAVAIIYSTAESTYSQSFDNLLVSPVPADNQVVPHTTLPIGWKVVENTANTEIRISAGSQTSGDSYLFGTTASNERALGTILSGTNNATVGAVIANTTGSTLTQFTITFTGEQWRRGGATAGTADKLAFGYRTDPTPETASISSGSFTAVTQLDFSSLNTEGSGAALNGNDPANQATKTFTVTGLNWLSGQALVIRWLDNDLSGSDDGLAIDNFTFSAATAPSLDAPSVTSLSPVVGPIAGGTVVTIIGSNFVSITSVTFGGAPAATFTVISATEISATTAAQAAGAVDVVVATATLSGSLAGDSDFTFVAPGGTVIDYATANSAYNQTFDDLLVPTVPFDNQVVPHTTLPIGWKVVESTANTDIRISSGVQTAGDSYLYGTAASNERALGTILSGTNSVMIGAVFANTTGSTLTQFTITFTGEQWRRGGATAGNFDTLVFGYRTDADPGTAAINSGTFTPVTELDFSSLNTAGTAAALDGNDPANQAAKSFTVTGLSWAPGEALVIRWLDTDVAGGADDGLAIDNFTFSAAPSVAAPSVTGITPVVGPTTGGTLVTITGLNFVDITSVTFGGVGVSFTVVSATEISATTILQSAGAVDVVVANAFGSGSLEGTSDFTFVQAPSVASVVVNGGPNVTLGTTGVTASLAGQHSVVKQILVTFDQAVTLGSEPFTVTPRAGVTVTGGATPSANAATTSVTMLSASEYLVTFVDDALDVTPSTHAGGILNSGVYDLTTIAGQVSINGITMAANQTSTLFALYGNIEANNLYDNATFTTPVPPGYSSGDGKTKVFVDPGSLFQFSDAFGSNATAPTGPPAYNVVFDYNLDGAIDPGDLFAFSDTFGITWQF